MSSPKTRKPGTGVPFDPEAVLLNDAGLLLNSHFSKALYEELRRARGGQHAENALVQIGCLHGLRDAHRAVDKAFGTPGPTGTLVSAPALTIELRGTPEFGTAAALELRGIWPERTEANGRLSTDGPAGAPACAVSAGYTSGWLSGILERDVVVLETRCSAAGDPMCEFVAREAANWLQRNESEGRALAAALPVVELRRALAEITTDREPADSEPEPVVHIWGPVMIVPFASLEETQMAADLLYDDPGLTEVSVVVIDVTAFAAESPLDLPAFAPILASIADAGAETVIAGLGTPEDSPLLALDPAPVLVCPDLDAAIAASFQIAESQQRPA